MSDREEIRMRFWCDVYAAMTQVSPENREFRESVAETALQDFDARFPPADDVSRQEPVKVDPNSCISTH